MYFSVTCCFSDMFFFFSWLLPIINKAAMNDLYT